MILLDTNAALWAAGQSSRLGPTAKSLMEQDDDVRFSAVLAVEVSIKSMTGSLPEGSRDAPTKLTAAGMSELAVTTRHALAIVRFPELARHDPFDRLMCAQALTEEASLLTSDRRLLGLGYDWILDARA